MWFENLRNSTRAAVTELLVNVIKFLSPYADPHIQLKNAAESTSGLFIEEDL